jgi:20S proteasome alpha/beta subunit
MTVCIAAISSDFIIGASDRMLTAADTEFEPATTKVFPLTSSIIAMTAGDSSIQSEILQEVSRRLNVLMKANPAKWLEVKQVTEIYKEVQISSKQKRTEDVFLKPLGLSIETFLSRQKEMDSNLVESLTKEILNYEIPGFETIITGIDDYGCHIYVINNSDYHCFDKVGFACIGIGARHASAQFMQARHGVGALLPETLLLTYSAKRRSEVSPGVGVGTDMFIIGPDKGSSSPVGRDIINGLRDIYKSVRTQEKEILQKSREAVNQFVQQIIEKANTKEQADSKIDGEEPPAEGNSVSVSSPKK